MSRSPTPGPLPSPPASDAEDKEIEEEEIELSEFAGKVKGAHAYTTEDIPTLESFVTWCGFSADPRWLYWAAQIRGVNESVVEALRKDLKIVDVTISPDELQNMAVSVWPMFSGLPNARAWAVVTRSFKTLFGNCRQTMVNSCSKAISELKKESNMVATDTEAANREPDYDDPATFPAYNDATLLNERQAKAVAGIISVMDSWTRTPPGIRRGLSLTAVMHDEFVSRGFASAAEGWRCLTEEGNEILDAISISSLFAYAKATTSGRENRDYDFLRSQEMNEVTGEVAKHIAEVISTKGGEGGKASAASWKRLASNLEEGWRNQAGGTDWRVKNPIAKKPNNDKKRDSTPASRGGGFIGRSRGGVNAGRKRSFGQPQRSNSGGQQNNGKRFKQGNRNRQGRGRNKNRPSRGR